MSQAAAHIGSAHRELLAGWLADCSEHARLLGELIAARTSCRRFQAEPVPREQLERIFAMAQFAPTWCNAQPWQVLLISGEAARALGDALYAHAVSRPADEHADYDFPNAYEGIYQERRRETARLLYESVGIAWGDRAAAGRQSLENFRFFGAPHVAIITSDAALGAYGAVDCGVYAAYVALAAQSLGIATIVQAALARYPDFIRARFGLPETRRIVFGIALGNADELHPANGFRTPRAAPGDVVRWID